jgi:hypothetical protein
MAKGKRYKSTEHRIREVCELALAHYEAGNQSKSYYAVWRNHIEPRYGICYRTFLSYLNQHLSPPAAPVQDDYPTLFDL